MKRALVQTEYDAFCRKTERRLMHALLHAGPEESEDDDDSTGVWSIAITEMSFRSNFYTAQTLADIFITASTTPTTGNLSLDLKVIPDPVFWKMILACLPRQFYVQVEDFEEFYDFLLGLGYVVIVDAVQIPNHHQLFKFELETAPGTIPLFENVNDIPPFIHATLGPSYNKNNHVHKPVDPQSVCATVPLIPPYITNAIDAISGMDISESEGTMPFILSVRPFIYIFGYDGPMELEEVGADCRDAVDMLGYILVKCLSRAYIESDEDYNPETDLNGFPLLLTKAWMNACFGRYSGTEPSEARFQVEVDMMPRGPAMSTESLIQCWLITYFDKFASDIVKESVTDKWLRQFASEDYPEVDFDDVMSTPSAIEGYLGDVLDAVTHLTKSGVRMDPAEVSCRLSTGHIALGYCDAFCAAYDDSNRSDPVFLRLFEIMPAHLFPHPEYAPAAINAAIFNRPAPAYPPGDGNPTRKLFNQMQTKMIAGHILRQAIEFRPVVLMAAPDATSLPFVVQGESFVLPYRSISSSPMVLFINQVAAIHLTTFALSTLPVFRDNPQKCKVAELPSHAFLYNQGTKQHDYFYFMEAWENKIKPAAPTIFTAIINLSSREMLFYKQYAGRSVATPARNSNRNRLSLSDGISIKPGCMHMYQRVVCEKEPGGRPYTYQTRLSDLEDYFDEEEFPFDDDQVHVWTEGILYVQISIAVYNVEHYSIEMHAALTALHDQKNMSFIGGLQQSSIYQGKQASTTGEDDFVSPQKKTKRYPYPLLYNQLTNAFRPETQLRFIGNLMMQRPEISQYFYQDVLFIYNGSAPNASERTKLLIPKNGRAYDAQKHALDLDVQVMSFTELFEKGHLLGAFRRTDNNSTFTTRDELLACGADQDKYTRIYPCIMPPLRNLHGVPGLFSKRDHYATSDGIGLESRFEPLAIRWI